MKKPSPIYRLVYVSRNRLGGDAVSMERAVANILAVSRRNNVRAGITGALLFSADCFAQTLEGPRDAVEAVFERIQCDPRHSNTVVLQLEPAAPAFADWSMAYGGRLDDERARFERLSNGGEPAARGAAADSVVALLQSVVLRAMPALG
jgi:hypothetical protein